MTTLPLRHQAVSSLFFLLKFVNLLLLVHSVRAACSTVLTDGDSNTGDSLFRQYRPLSMAKDFHF